MLTTIITTIQESIHFTAPKKMKVSIKDFFSVTKYAENFILSITTTMDKIFGKKIQFSCEMFLFYLYLLSFFFFFFLQQFFASINKIFPLGRRLDTRLWFYVLSFSGSFLIFSDLILRSHGNSWGNSYISCLLLIIMLCFTCGEQKNWQNIKKSQNIMFIIVYTFLFCFLCIY